MRGLTSCPPAVFRAKSLGCPIGSAIGRRFPVADVVSVCGVIVLRGSTWRSSGPAAPFTHIHSLRFGGPSGKGNLVWFTRHVFTPPEGGSRAQGGESPPNPRPRWGNKLTPATLRSPCLHNKRPEVHQVFT